MLSSKTQVANQNCQIKKNNSKLLLFFLFKNCLFFIFFCREKCLIFAPQFVGVQKLTRLCMRQCRSFRPPQFVGVQKPLGEFAQKGNNKNVDNFIISKGYRLSSKTI